MHVCLCVRVTQQAVCTTAIRHPHTVSRGAKDYTHMHIHTHEHTAPVCTPAWHILDTNTQAQFV